ncbi:HEAT repeat domain-containing protein [Streptomyces sp. NPDC008139]|uniref:HEAT repeat domain-containing protein n=1 Tax=Streptomyces sp. NPDC008139 TaxID=3364814 RepID=UPI0036E3DFD2
MTEKDPRASSTRLSREEISEVVHGDPIARAAKSRNNQVIRRRQLYANSAGGVLADLAGVGFSIESVGELLRLRLNYRTAVPILLDWLPRSSYLPLAEDITRTLSVGFAKKEAAPKFLTLFREPPEVEDPMRPENSEPPKEHLRWVLGNGLGIFADPSITDELFDLACDRRYGQARSQIVLALPKTKDDRTPRILQSLLEDSTVSAFAIEALGKMRITEARKQIEGMLTSPDMNIRDQAKKALKRIAE